MATPIHNYRGRSEASSRRSLQYGRGASQKRKSFEEKRPPVIRLKQGEIDYTFLFMVILMLSIGLVMLLSSSAPEAKKLYDNSYYFFLKQGLCAVIGLAAMWFFSKINYNNLKKYVPTAMIICCIMLVLVLLPKTGVSHNGSSRWLNTPIVEIQPSEFMKPLIAMYFAMMIESGKYDLHTLKGCLPYGGVLLVVLGLLLLETHLSGAIVIGGIGLVLMVAGGMPVKPIVIAVLAIGVVGVFYIKSYDAVRWARITSFLNPFEDTQGSGFQTAQSLYTLGSGGLFGRGLGQSIQKYSYLPEPYNDFIFSVICEELGFVGAIFIIALFAALIMRSASIAANAPDLYSSLTATGITAHLAIQTLLNIAVVTASVPNTGISLPFFSYGGTSIITLLAEMGILLNISRFSIKSALKK